VLALSDVERRGSDEAHAELTVRAADCAGHFPGCPALPVAKLMHALALVSGSLMRSESDASAAACYLPQLAEIEADSLAFAGERLQLHAALESRSEQTVVTRVTAQSSSGARVGAGRFTMRPCR
jgi:3-hydroxymyristoyl/3-hydroxydecanoyl-(acyl carrier protein) dehydratase